MVVTEQNPPAITRRSRGRAVAIVATVLLLAASLLAGAAFLLPRSDTMVVHPWEQEIAALPDEQVLPCLRQIAEDDAAVPALVQSLASDRRAVSEAARTVLHEQLGRWRALPAGEFSARHAELAHHLAEHVTQLSPRAQTDAADLATQILLCPIDDETVDALQLIADCETVLRASPVSHTARLTNSPADADEIQNPSVHVETRVPKSLLTPPDRIVELPRLPSPMN